MANDILSVAEDFWNIRGSFRVGGVVDVGTQASLVRLASGKFVFLDAYTLSGAPRRAVNELTAGGENVEAILVPVGVIPILSTTHSPGGTSQVRVPSG